MDFSPASDSSGDSPVHNVPIRLSDIGKIDMYGNAKSARFEIDSQTHENNSQLKAALRKIDGTPGNLEKAIDLEQRKAIFGKSISLPQSPRKGKRAPPRPPVAKEGKDRVGGGIVAGGRSLLYDQKENAPPLPPRKTSAVTTHVPTRRALEFHPVDYSTIASPESIDTARASLNRFVTREKIFQTRGGQGGGSALGGGDKESRRVVPDAPPVVPRVNNRPLNHVMSDPNLQGHMDSHIANSYAKNLFPHDLTLNPVLNSNHPVNIPQLHAIPLATPTPDMRHPTISVPPVAIAGGGRGRGVYDDNLEKPLQVAKTKNSKPIQARASTTVGYYKEVASLFEKSCRNILGSDNIGHIVKHVSDLLSHKTSIAKLHINHYQLWLYDATADIYRAEIFPTSQQKECFKEEALLHELPCELVIETLQSLTKGGIVSTDSRNQAFPELLSMLINSDLPRVNRTDTDSDSDYSDVEKDECTGERIHPTCADWKSVQCVELSLMSRKEKYSDQKADIPIGFLILGAWTTEKWCFENKIKRKNKAVTIDLAKPVENPLGHEGGGRGNAEGDTGCAPDCRAFFLSELSQKLSMAIACRFQVLQLQEETLRTALHSRQGTMTVMLERSLREIDRDITHLTNFEKKSNNYASDYVELLKATHADISREEALVQLCRSTAKVGTEALGLSMSWVVLNTTPNNSPSTESHFFLFNSCGDSNKLDNKERVIHEPFPPPFRRSEDGLLRRGRGGGSGSSLREKKIPHLDYSVAPLTEIMEAANNQKKESEYGDRELKPSIVTLPIDQLTRSGLISLEQSAKWLEAHITPVGPAKNPAVHLLVIPFHFFPDDVLDKCRQEGHDMLHSSALILALHASSPFRDNLDELLLSPQLDKQQFLIRQSALMIDCFLDNLNHLQCFYEKFAQNQVNNSSKQLWKIFISQKQKQESLIHPSNDLFISSPIVALSRALSVLFPGPVACDLQLNLLNKLGSGRCQLLLRKDVCQFIDPSTSFSRDKDEDNDSFAAYYLHVEYNQNLHTGSSHKLVATESTLEPLNATWINTLLNGKSVIVTNVAHCRKTAQGKHLLQFVQSVDQAATSFVLCPIQVQGSTSILFIPDIAVNNLDFGDVQEKVREGARRVIESDHGNLSLFKALELVLLPSVSKLVDFVTASDFLDMIASILDVCCAEMKLSVEVQKESVKVSELQSIIQLERLKEQNTQNNYLLATYFSIWQTSFLLKKNETACASISVQTEHAPEAKMATLFSSLEGMLGRADKEQEEHEKIAELSQTPSFSKACLVSQGSEAYDCFVVNIRHCISELFPDDVIFISVTDKASFSCSHAHGMSGRRSIQSDGGDSQVFKSELNESINSKYLIVDNKREQIMPHVHVQVIRSSTIPCSFSPWEISALHSLCLCARATSAIVLQGTFELLPIRPVDHLSVQTDPPPIVKAPPPLLPFLQQTLPLLFMAQPSVNSESMTTAKLDMSSLSETIISWVKVMCGAEVALLRVKPSKHHASVSGEESSVVQLQEMLISSDDFSHSHVNSDLTREQGIAFENWVQDAQHHHSNELVFRLPGMGGELKLLGSDKKGGRSEAMSGTWGQQGEKEAGFNQEDKDIATLAAYLLTCSAQMHQKNARAVLETLQHKRLYSEMESKLQQLTQQLKSREVSSTAYRMQLDLVAVMLQLQVQLLQATCQQDLCDAVFCQFNKVASLSATPGHEDMAIQSAIVLFRSKKTGKFIPLKPTTYDAVIQSRNLQKFRQSKKESNATAAGVMDFKEEFSLSQLQDMPCVGSSGGAKSGNPTDNYGQRAPHRRVMLISKSSFLTEDSSDVPVFGAILFMYNPSQSAPTSSPIVNEQIQDHIFDSNVLFDVVSGAMTAVSTNFDLHEAVEKYTIQKEEVDYVHGLNKRLSEDVGKAQEVVALLSEDIRNIKVDRDERFAVMKEELNASARVQQEREVMLTELKKKHEVSLNTREDQIEQLKTDLEMTSLRGESLSRGIEHLENLVLGYAADSRLESRHVLSWLHEVADTTGVYVELVRQDSLGNLVLNNSNYDGSSLSHKSVGVGVNPSVIFSAAREALRDVKAVEVVTVLDRNRISSSSSSNSYATQAVVLCLPNRLGKALGSSGVGGEGAEHTEDDAYVDNNQNVCYAFIRLGDEHFSDVDKSYFNCAVGILSKSSAIADYNRRKYTEKYKTMYSNSKYPISTTEMENMLSHLEGEKVRIKRLKDTISYSNVAWSADFKSWTEFLPAAEAGVRHILSEIVKSETSCSIEAFAWSPHRQLSSHHSSFGNGRGNTTPTVLGLDTMDSVAHRVYVSGTLMRSGNLMWVPLKIHSGDVVCVLCCERKFNLHTSNVSSDGNDENFSGNTIASRDNGLHKNKAKDGLTGPGSEVLVFTITDEEAICLFCNLGTGAVDRLISHKEALVSVQQASRAILSLQEKNAAMESKMTRELANKLKFEEAMQFGCEVMSGVIRKRMEFFTMVDSLKKALKTVSSSFECIILTSFSQNQGDIVETVPPISPENTFSSALKKKYYFFDESNGSTKVVYLSPMDIEFVAMETQRQRKANSSANMQDSKFADNNSLYSNEAQLVVRANSWAIRYVSEDDSLNQSVYAMAVPCALKPSSRTSRCGSSNDENSTSGVGEGKGQDKTECTESPSAVVVVLRHKLDFDQGDEICVSFLSKIFSWCADILLHPELGGSEKIIHGLRANQVALKGQIFAHEENERRHLERLERGKREKEEQKQRDTAAAAAAAESAAAALIGMSDASAKKTTHLKIGSAEDVEDEGDEEDSIAYCSRMTSSLSHLFTDLLELPLPVLSSVKRPVECPNALLQWLETVTSSIEDSSQSLITDKSSLFVGGDTPTLALDSVEMVLACAKSVFGSSRVLNVWSSSSLSSSNVPGGSEEEHPQHFDTFFLMDVDSTKVRVHKDSLFIGPTKLIFWEERETVVKFFNKQTQKTDTSASTTCLKAVLSFPSLHEHPIWFKLKKSDEEIPETYKIKFLLMLKTILTQQIELKKVQEMFLTLHNRQCSNVTKFNDDMNMLQREFDSYKQQEEVRHSQLQLKVEQKTQKQAESMETMKQKCKLMAKDCLNDKMQCQAFFLRVSTVAQYILTVHDGEETATIVDKKKRKKRFSLQRLLRRLCEMLSPLVEMSVASVLRGKRGGEGGETGGPLKTTDPHVHLTLSWVAGSTQWIGNSAQSSNSIAPRTTYADVKLSSNNPILVAQAKKRVVVVAPSDEAVKGLREQKGFNAARKQNPQDFYVSAEEGKDYSFVVSTLFPEQTVILPMVLPSRNEEIIIVLKMPSTDNSVHMHNAQSETQSPATATAAIALPLALSSWLFLRDCILSAVHTHDLTALHETTQRTGATQGLYLLLKKLFTHLQLHQKAKAFSHLKQHLHFHRESRLHRKHTDERGKVTRLHEHIRELEQSVADWMELIKGVNGASSGIERGLPGLWGQASRPLMQLITPHVILDGCGLLVATPEGEVLDLAVMELSAPDYDKSFLNQSFHSVHVTDLNDDMAPADIQIRSASDLGANVQSLAWSILSSMGGVSNSVQRLWKLTKNTAERFVSRGGAEEAPFEEQMWLVPIRTASEVLGVLRVAVRVPLLPEGATNSEGSSFIQTKTVHFNTKGKTPNQSQSMKQNDEMKSDDFDSYNEEDSVTYTNNLLTPPLDRNRRSKIKKYNDDIVSIESAKRNLINFAEVMAPLVTAARQLDNTKSQEQEFHDTISNLENQRSDTQQELSHYIQQIRLFSRCMTVLGQVTGENLREEDLTHDPLDTLRRRLKPPLESILDDVSIDFISSRDSLSKPPFAALDGQGLQTMEEPIVMVNTDKSMVLSGQQQIVLQATFRQRHESGLLDESYVGDPGPANMLKALLPPLASVISGFYSALVREVNAKHQVTTAVENLHALKHQHDDVVLMKEDFSYKEIIAAETSEFNRKLVDVMEACLLCSVEEHEYINSQSDGPISTQAQHLLQNLSALFTDMFKGSSQCIFNFALLTSQSKAFADVTDINVIQSEVDNASTEQRSLMWYSADTTGRPDRTENALFISEDTLQISANLAAACISKGVKSCVDVGIDRNDMETDKQFLRRDNFDRLNEQQEAVKILTVPITAPVLSSPHPSSSYGQSSSHSHTLVKHVVIGVLQVYTPIQRDDKQEINDFCESISRTVGAVLGHDLRHQGLLRRNADMMSVNYVLQNSVADISSESDLLRRQALAWQGCLACIKHTLSGSEIHGDEVSISKNILAAADQLKPTGIMVTAAALSIEDEESKKYEDMGTISLNSAEGMSSTKTKNDAELHLSIDKELFMTDAIDKKIYSAIFDALRDVLGSFAGIIKKKHGILRDNKKEIIKLTKKTEKLRMDREIVTKKLVETVGECKILAKKISSSEKESVTRSQQQEDWRNKLTGSVSSLIRTLGADVLNLFQELPTAAGGKELSTSLQFPVETTEQLFSRFALIISDALTHAVEATLTTTTTTAFATQNLSPFFHVSVLVTSRKSLHRQPNSTSTSSSNSPYFDGNMVMFEGNSPRGTPIRSTAGTGEQKIKQTSSISKCFRSGVMQVAQRHGGEGAGQQKTEDGSGRNSGNGHRGGEGTFFDSSSDLLPEDLEGVPPLMAAASSTTMLVIPLHTCVADLVSVVRVVFDNTTASSTLGKTAPSTVLLKHQHLVFKTITDFISSLGLPVSRLFHHRNELLRLEVTSLRDNTQHAESLKQAQTLIGKYKRLHKVVCRESTTFMDPPTAALMSHIESNPITNHPASLPPLAALQDTSIKALSMIRSLLTSEGQALLLRNPNSDPQSYQIIYTGNALSWPGIEQGTFGMVTAGGKRLQSTGGEGIEATSLVEAVMSSHKHIELSNAHADSRYNSSIDGLCAKQTPMLAVPVRGRSGGVVGVLLATREQNSSPFSSDDVIACDLVSAFSSISLYWGQGLGYIHDKLTKSMKKMESLEQAVSALKTH